MGIWSIYLLSIHNFRDGKEFLKIKDAKGASEKSLHPKCAIFVKWQKVKVKKWLRGILEAGLRGSLNVPGRFRQRFARSTQWWPKFTISQVDSQKNVIGQNVWHIILLWMRWQIQCQWPNIAEKTGESQTLWGSRKIQNPKLGRIWEDLAPIRWKCCRWWVRGRFS